MYQTAFFSCKQGLKERNRKQMYDQLKKKIQQIQQINSLLLLNFVQKFNFKKNSKKG